MLNYCCEPVDQIEGYIPEEKRTTKMVIHHRLESHDESGTLRTRFLSMQQLKDAGLYYNRPASELIWMTESAHKSLHQEDLSYKENLQKMSKKNIGRKMSDTQKNTLREKAIGRKHTAETKAKLREINIGKTMQKSVKDRISNTLKGRCTTWSVKSKIKCIETGEIFDSANACAVKYGIDAGLLGRKCDKGIANFPKKLPNLHFIRITEEEAAKYFN